MNDTDINRAIRIGVLGGILVVLAYFAFFPPASAEGFNDESHGKALDAWMHLHTECETYMSKLPAETYASPGHVGLYYTACMATQYELAHDAIQDRIDKEFKSL